MKIPFIEAYMQIVKYLSIQTCQESLNHWRCKQEQAYMDLCQMLPKGVVCQSFFFISLLNNLNYNY